jgi:hypothetical protein
MLVSMIRIMWEYVSMWHRANWVQYNYDWRASGWAGWVMAPAATPGPTANASDSEALNAMGQRGWELIESKMVWDLPDGVTNASLGAQRQHYLFKRPIH